MDYKEKYENWLINPVFDKETKEELKAIKNNDKEIKDRFYKDLEFGTAGLRGVIGAGSNRMNKYTVGKATQGLANYIIKQNGQEKGVAIAYDSRNMSKEFSEITANVLNANGIKTYVFDSIRPVPELSFAVRELGCIAGVMITASHNPAKYNGYKVYWEDGAQITSPNDKAIMEEVNSIEDFSEIKTIEKEDAIENYLYFLIGEEIDSKYINTIKKYSLNPSTIKNETDLSIVYTPLHGTGYNLVKRILKELGFTNLNIVEEQAIPDGNFSTVKYPNPEDKEAFKMALELAKKVNAEIVLATDPDADRLGVYSLNKKTGEYKAFTGNMSALLILEYIMSQKKEKGLLKNNSAIVKSIVSSTMAKEISKEYNLKIFEVLTGFKYIGEKIKEFEENREYNFEFGFEESYGCLVGTHARDKDAIVAVMMLCEAAAYYKTQGKTLWDVMVQMYEKYGYYKEETIAKTYEGADGQEKIKQIMDNYRTNTPNEFAEFKVKKIRDFSKGIILDLETGKEEKTTLPKSNVLYFELENDAWICVRPSGTEPKIKYYIGVKGKSFEDADEKIDKLVKIIK